MTLGDHTASTGRIAPLVPLPLSLKPLPVSRLEGFCSKAPTCTKKSGVMLYFTRSAHWLTGQLYQMPPTQLPTWEPQNDRFWKSHGKLLKSSPGP